MIVFKKIASFIYKEVYNAMIALSYIALFVGAVLICPLGYEVAKMGADPKLLFAPGLMVLLGVSLFFFGIFSKIARGEREAAVEKAIAERDYKKKLMGVDTHDSFVEKYPNKIELPDISPRTEDK
ncbi:MAG: hypothetical protein OEZ36_08155 [Spirochaetota bacterium]|nr:hypothetical protein [Spirochaetota bacterium]